MQKNVNYFFQKKNLLKWFTNIHFKGIYYFWQFFFKLLYKIF